MELKLGVRGQVFVYRFTLIRLGWDLSLPEGRKGQAQEHSWDPKQVQLGFQIDSKSQTYLDEFLRRNLQKILMILKERGRLIQL